MITKTIEVELLTSNQIRTRPVHQWDTGQIIKITDATIPDGTAVQFGNRFMKVAYEVYMEGNQVTIPAAALQQSRDLTAYIVVVDEDSETTVYEISIPVTSKPKPEGYIADDESENIKTLINSKASASGWTPNMYLGTDADGNMVTKDAPEGGGSGATEEQLQQIQTNASDIAALKTGKEAAGTAASAVSEHNTATDAHNDIRLLVEGLTTRLNALANSDDTTLDQMAEVVAYIKDNRSLIESITTSKVSVSDIVDNLTTNVAEKPLSAAQGVALKALIDAIAVPTKVSQLENDSMYLTEHQDISGKVDAIPEYIVTAAEAVAKIVNHRQTENSVCFAFMTDAHLGYYTDIENVAGKHAGQALKVINDRCLLDFVVHGGDYTTGAYNTTVDDTFEDMEDYMELIGSMTDLPQVWCIGNHDDAPYQATADRLTQIQSFAAVGRKNRVSNASCPAGCNYGYLDFESQKIRVIYLDTHDKRSWGTVAVGSGETAPEFLYADNIGGAQLQFLADTALDFSSKSDPSEWAVIVVSHAVLNGEGTCTDAVSGESHDANTANAATILDAYQRGNSGSVSNNGVTVSYDFSALESRAAVVCCVHGNDHMFASEMVGNEILSICCPNICNGRERESDDGNTYTKTAGTATGTSFCIITVDRVNQKIYADNYGAGIDREFDYTIPSAQGYTNVLPLATDTDGSIYMGTGYRTGYKLSSDGSASEYAGFTITGFIPCSLGDVVRLKNITMQPSASTVSNQRISFYDSSKTHITQMNASLMGNNLAATTDSNGNIDQFTVKNSSGNPLDSTVAYFRLNGTYIGEDSIITINEPIE